MLFQSLGVEAGEPTDYFDQVRLATAFAFDLLEVRLIDASDRHIENLLRIHGVKVREESLADPSGL